MFRLWAWFMTNERRYRWGARLLRLVPSFIWKPRPWTAARDLRPLAKRSFRARWADREGAK